MNRHRRGALLSALLSMVWLAAGHAEEGLPPASEPGEVARAREFLKLATQEGAAYELRLQDGDARLERHNEAVLQWSNPVLGQIYGGVFLWTHEGRPEAVASIFKWYSPHTHMTHEWQSLSTRNLAATRDGREVWATSDPGVRLQPVPGAPIPAESRAGRLRQMRGLARQFSGTLNHHRHGLQNLRLLTQPLYRYEDGAGEWTDGAVFAFVFGTDPDLLLLIESRRTADRELAWHYAFARMNWQDMRGLHDGREVWECPRLSPQEFFSGTGPYAQIQFKDPQ